MKNLFKFCLAACAMLLTALPSQAQYVSNDNEDGVYRVQKGAPRYKDGEVIVKFKDSEQVAIRRNAKGRFEAASVSKVNAKLQKMGTFEMEQLMPLTGGKVAKGMRKAPASGRMIKDVDLSQLYVVRFDKDKMSVDEAVEQLKQLDNVEFAEPNGIATICAQGDGSPVFDDPMYSQQWNLDAINMPMLWAQPKVTGRRPVIAILDTGVDINHPDLKDNIWTNTLEQEGTEFEDDDNNGFYDDIHGWDFVNNTAIINNGMDGNGHGTHCAGIAAACGNNGIGIVGANPDALILPIKVLGDNGVGDLANIIKGIDYAVAAGADILSMSLGGWEDAAMQRSLMKAYAHYIITVASAGNAHTDITVLNSMIPSPNFPAAYDFVIGVESSDKSGALSSFSNYDSDGPFFSTYPNITGEFWNYGCRAPGSNILSTFPGGKYKEMNGTSMACPLVAGAISRILQVKGFDYAQDYGMYGDVYESKDEKGVYDAFKNISWNEDNRQVALRLLSVRVDDSEFGDGDGELDAGEIVDLYPTIRSLWGRAENIKMKCYVKNDNISKNAVEFITGDIDFGLTLNSQGMSESVMPFRVKINEDVNDSYHLLLYFQTMCDNMSEEEQNREEEIGYDVVNGIEINGVMTKNTTLKAGKRYVITNTLYVPEDVVLTIEPGATIYLNQDVQINCPGIVNAVGTPDSLITIKMNSYATRTGSIRFDNDKNKIQYVQFVEIIPYGTRRFQGDISNNIFQGGAGMYDGRFDRCVFYDINNGIANTTSATNNNLINIDGYAISLTSLGFVESLSGNNIYNNGKNWEVDYVTCSFPNYFGSSKEEIVREGIWDVYHGKTGYYDLRNMLTRPNPNAHGVVWKVLVDGKDAQDEFSEMLPLGPGKHKFEVYYNRPVNKEVTPKVSMGLRYPYTQVPISEDCGWNEAGDIYTAYLTVTGKSGTDGLNRIVVEGGEDDEHFPIPTEGSRFNVMVQVAGALSTGLMAEPGLGKVKLTWETDEADFADLMGYNLYRYNEREEKYIEWDWDDDLGWGDWEKTRIVRDTIKVNEMLIDPSETTLTDYNVEPGTTYYYYIMEMGTDLQQHDVSKVVAATPLTATKGDANGSMNVDIADVVTEVNYLTGQNPQPFIFEAADVNSDETVNILDVVGTVNIIITPKGAATASTDAKATYTVENGILYVDSDTPLGGVQVSIKANANTVFEALEGLDGMEQAGVWVAEDEYMLLAYSMSGRVIGSGKHPLMRIGDAEVTDVVASDAKGHNVLAINGTATSIASLPFGIENYEGAEVRYYDLTGRRVSAEAARKSGVAIQSLFIDGKCVKSYKILNR